MPRATGTFTVTLTPQSTPTETDAPVLGRLAIAKQYSGDLAGTGAGQMLTAHTAVDGSATYVALEHISGTLAGRVGTFVVHHLGVMTRGEGQLSIVIAPDSGTGALVGISGTVAIQIDADGTHHYTLDYALP